MTTPTPRVQQATCLPIADLAIAIASIPADLVGIETRVGQTLCRASADWYVLVGPDEPGLDLAWVMPLVYAETDSFPDDWSFQDETVGQVRITHFTRD